MKKAFAITLLLLLTCCFIRAQQITPALNLVTGKTYGIRSVSVIRLHQNINNHPLENEMTVTADIIFKVTGKHDSLYNISAHYNQLQLRLDLPVGTINALSGGDSTDIYTAILTGISGQPFGITLTKKGNIITLSALDSLISNVTERYTNIPAEQRAQAMNQVKQSFGEKAFRSFLMPPALLPAIPVAINSKWAVDNNTDTPVPLNLHTLYILKQLTPTSIQIAGTAIIKNNDTTAAPGINGMPVKHNLVGTGTVNATVDKRTGWIISADITRKVKGNTIIQDNPQLPGGMLIPFEMNVTTTIKNIN